MKKERNFKHKKGVAILEVIIALAIFMIAVTVFYRVYQTAALQAIESKYRTGAINLANERMEHVRNISYGDIGVRGSSVDGALVRDEIVTVNSLTYRVVLFVTYIDDAADGLLSTTDTTHFEDYKRVKTVVLWGEGVDQSAITYVQAANEPEYGRRRVELLSTFVPPGGLEGTATSGIISVNVLESDGTPVANATVEVICADCNGVGVSEVQNADASGNATLIVPPSNTGTLTAENYEVCVSQSGYERVCTKLPYSGATAPNEGSYDPQNTHLTVLQGQRTTATFIIDRVADFELAVRDPFCQELSPSGPFTIDVSGGRLLGNITSGATTQDIYSLDTFFGNTTHVTNNDGEVVIYTDTNADGTIATDGSDAASHGKYTFDDQAFESNYGNLLFWKMVPSDDERMVTYVNADTHNCNFIVVDRTINGVFVHVTDDSDASNPIPIEGALVRAQDPISAYSAVRTTDKHGYAYFPEAYNVPMLAGDYEITVEKDDYGTHTETVTITSGLEEADVDLVPTP